MSHRFWTLIALTGLASSAFAQAPAPRQAAPAPAPTRAPSPAGAARVAEPDQEPGGEPQLPPLPAHLRQAPTPKTPPPGMALASMSGGQLYLRSVLPFAKPGTPAPTGAAGAAAVELASVAEPFDARQVQVKTAAGAAVRAETLAGRLAREVPVVVGYTTFPPDPTYLRALKDETLVILIPPPPPGADEDAPAEAPTATPSRAPAPPARTTPAPTAPAPAPAPRPRAPR